MANRVNKVINGTAADEPSDHRTQFKRKKIPNINLELKKKVVMVIATILKMTITLTVMKTTKIMIQMMTKIIEIIMMMMTIIMMTMIIIHSF